MTVWGDDIAIFDIRKRLLSDEQFWSDKSAGSYAQVHAYYYASAKEWSVLSPWRRDRIRAIAVAKAMPTCALSGRSACQYWGIAVLGYNAPVEVVSLSKAQLRGRKSWPDRVHMRKFHVLAADIVQEDGFRVTSRERSLLDLCRFGTFTEGLVAVEDYLRSPESLGNRYLVQKLESMGPVQGVRRARSVLTEATVLSESVAESLAKAKILESQLFEKLDQQVEVRSPQGYFRLDFLADDWLNIETDGDIKYPSDPAELSEVMKRERAREKAVLNMGYTTVRASWRDIIDGTLIKNLKEAIVQREQRLSRAR